VFIFFRFLYEQNQTMKPISLISYLLFIATFAYGQVNQYIFRHIAAEHGLTGNYVNKIIQDKNGFIWVASNNGLNKLEGNSIINYRHNPLKEGTIPGGQVRDILEVESGKIWVAAMKVAVFDPIQKTFTIIQIPDSIPQLNFANALVQDYEGNIWVGSSTGLYQFSKKEEDTDLFNISYFSIKNDPNQQDLINALALGKNGTLWVGTYSSGFYRFDMGAGRFQQIVPEDKETAHVLSGDIWDIILDRKNTVWISSLNGLAIWEDGDIAPKQLTSLGEGKFQFKRAIQSLWEDQDGVIWIGTGEDGACGYHPESGEIITYLHKEGDNSIRENDIHYVFKDKDTNLWFGYHDHGISLMYQKTLNYEYLLPSEDHPKDHPLNSMGQLEEDQEGGIWFGTEQGLLYQSPDGSSTQNYIPFPDQIQKNSKSNWINDIVTYGQKLLLTTEEGKVLFFDKEKDTFETIAHREDVTRLWGAIHDEKNIYVGALQYGMYVISKEDFGVEYIPNPWNDEQKDSRSMQPYIDVEGNIWIFSFNITVQVQMEFYKYDPDTKSIDLAFSLPTDILSSGPPSVSVSDPGIFYMPSQTGIIRVDVINMQMDYFFQAEIGQGNYRIFGVKETVDGGLYVSGRNVLGKLEPLTGDYVIYEGGADEWPVEIFMPFILSNGDLIFSGYGGYIRMEPGDLVDETNILTPFIQDIRVGDQTYLPSYQNSELRLNHDESIFISYSTIYYQNPSLLVYRYRVPGFIDEWQEVGRQQQIYLSKIPPGDYQFQVQATTNNQSFQGEIAEYPISVMPPWWRTKLAFIAYVMFIAGLIFLTDRLQRNRIIRREREKTRERELEQAKEIEKAYKELKATQSQLIQSEKMASLGELTAGIAHEIQNPLNFVNNFSDVSIDLMDELDEEMKEGNGEEVEMIKKDLKSNLEKIHHHGQRASSIVKGMLSHSRMGNPEKELTDINVLADEYLRLAYHGLRAKDKSFNAEFKAELDESLPKIKVISQDIGRVFLNIINNAFYAVASKAQRGENGFVPEVILKTKKLSDKVEIRIKDNADGIPRDVLDKIFQPFFTTKPSGQGTGLGLSLSYDIITKGHGGHLAVDTKDGEGTEFIIELPIKP
jgi:signal transduction histidine kinase/ligand-binding sensor domain-containing protein